MHRAAHVIMAEHGGTFPRDVEAVRRLPGIGRYTAGAILSIACDAREPILEANTIRLLARLVAYRGDPRKAAGQRLLWHTAEQLLPRRRPLESGAMELGSLGLYAARPSASLSVVDFVPRSPRAWPVIPAKLEAVEAVRGGSRRRRRGRVLLLRGDGELPGLWTFRDLPKQRGRHWRELTDKVAEATGLDRAGRATATLKHGVTRFRIARGYAADYGRVLQPSHDASSSGSHRRSGRLSAERHRPPAGTAGCVWDAQGETA
jgi:A/G-specific adenine glycosylase